MKKKKRFPFKSLLKERKYNKIKGSIYELKPMNVNEHEMLIFVSNEVRKNLRFELNLYKSLKLC